MENTDLCRKLFLIDLGPHEADLELNHMSYCTVEERTVTRPLDGRHWVINYILDGQMVIEDGRCYGPDSFFVRAPGVHARIEIEARTSLYHCHFSVMNAAVRELSAHAPGAIGASGIPGSRVYDCCILLPDGMQRAGAAGLRQDFEAIASVSSQKSRAWVLATRSMILTLFCKISELYLAQLDGLGTNLLIERSIDLLEGDLAGLWSVSSLARALQVNSDHLGRTFKRVMGETVGAYLLRRRMMRARELLAEGRLQVQEVAATVGYDDALYFSRIFRRENCISPRDYRTSHSSRRFLTSG